MHLRKGAEPASAKKCGNFIVDDGKSPKYEGCFEVAYPIFKPLRN